MVSNAKTIRYAYKKTQPTSSLRRLLVDAYAYLSDYDTFIEDPECWPAAFLANVAAVSLRRIENSLDAEACPDDIDPFEHDAKDYFISEGTAS